MAEAARPAVRVPATPANPERAAESVLGLVHDLETELVKAREREDALRGNLDDARAELSRIAGEARAGAERVRRRRRSSRRSAACCRSCSAR